MGGGGERGEVGHTSHKTKHSHTMVNVSVTSWGGGGGGGWQAGNTHRR